MNRALLLARQTIKKCIPRIAKGIGIHLLDKKATVAYLQAVAEEVFAASSQVLVLPEVRDLEQDEKVIFATKREGTGSAYVWKYENKNGQARQLSNGSLVIAGKVLDLGFGNSVVLKDMLKPVRRTACHARILVAPWSHYWTGYFDYIFFICLTLSRIRLLLTPEELAETIVCYPLFNTEFEREISTLLGYKPENFRDSRTTQVTFDTCLFGNNDNWFYPNQENILAFRNLLNKAIPTEQIPTRKIYIQRNGRRKVSNESALRCLLQKYDIEFISDVPRSFLDQVRLYRSASLIIGPHGASFANILWAQPGTWLLELFPATYMPEYFRYLAELLGLRYAAYCHGPAIGNDHHYVEADIEVDIQELEKCLQRIH